MGVFVYFRKGFFNGRSSQFLGATYFDGASYALISTKNGLGYIMSGLVTNSFGHPASTNISLRRTAGQH
jgi:hypothetical protein